MAILKFRIYFEEDESVYRDVAIRHTQNFKDLHDVILKAYEFDNKHKATFFRSNDHWLRGREISLEVYDKEYKAPPLIMQETTIGSEIRDPNQRFIYLYDFNKNWGFLVELINAPEYKPRLLGKKVRFSVNGESREGIVIDGDDENVEILSEDKFYTRCDYEVKPLS